MIDTIHITDEQWQQQNEALLAQAEQERAQRHLWNATLLEMQYHASEEKRREMETGREARPI